MLPEHDWIRYKIFNALMRFFATAERSKDTWNHEKFQYAQASDGMLVTFGVSTPPLIFSFGYDDISGDERCPGALPRRKIAGSGAALPRGVAGGTGESRVSHRSW